VKVDIPEIRALLGAGWKRIDYDVNGEWNSYLILDQFLNSKADSRRAAAGWAGDRFAVYESAAGDVFIAQVSEWDTDNDAREFFDAYARRTQLRYAEAQASEVKSGAADYRQWKTNEGGVALRIDGKRVVILEGIPSGVDPNSLLLSVAG